MDDTLVFGKRTHKKIKKLATTNDVSNTNIIEQTFFAALESYGENHGIPVADKKIAQNKEFEIVPREIFDNPPNISEEKNDNKVLNPFYRNPESAELRLELDEFLKNPTGEPPRHSKNKSNKKKESSRKQKKLTKKIESPKNDDISSQIPTPNINHQTAQQQNSTSNNRFPQINYTSPPHQIPHQFHHHLTTQNRSYQQQQQQQTFVQYPQQQPNLSPPKMNLPPDDVLEQLLQQWYWSGYHAGLSSSKRNYV